VRRVKNSEGLIMKQTTQTTQTTQTRTRTHATRKTDARALAAVTALRTPYHALGGGSPRIPAWAQRRSVYRSAGRTLYCVGTDQLGTARRDLRTLASRGWEVEIDPDRDGEGASIVMSRRAA